MSFKDWFKSGGAGSERAPSVDALIARGSLDQAESQLRLRLRRSSADIHARLKLADLLLKLGRQRDAVDEYLVAAESYARDGFFDKSTALLRKIERMAPSNERIALKIQALQRAKALERRRELIVGSLLEADAQGERRFGSSALELQQLWTELCQSPVIEELSDAQVKRLFHAAEVVRIEEDEQLAAAGERNEAIYLLGKGQIEARIPLKGGAETAIRSFSGGDLIGDRALLEHQPWPARYVAVKRTAALRLAREGLAQALTGETDPKGFLETLRLQRQDHKVVSAIRELEAAG